ncbi:MAG: hypothetical protein OEM39_01340 [Acidimicrobiia bacterium]|nr:hypothetical protein [Acidimicrobiia bacterium]MDH3462819.1 hypothetical protein [Acidimicrobiia bacterium]
MRAIVITYTIKTDRWEDALSSLRSVVEQIGRFNGLESWINTANRQTGKGNAVAVFDSDVSLAEALPAITKIVNGLGAYMTATPQVEEGNVLAQINHTG